MEHLLSLFPILFHRIGLILSVVGATLLVLLPSLYPRDDDFHFAQTLSRVLLRITRLGLLLLVFTGLLRLISGIPPGFIIKLILVIITIIWSFAYAQSYPSASSGRFHLVQLILICSTALVGIFL